MYPSIPTFRAALKRYRDDLQRLSGLVEGLGKEPSDIAREHFHRSISGWYTRISHSGFILLDTIADLMSDSARKE